MGRRLIALLVLVGVVASLVPVAGAQIITNVERRNPDNNSGDTEVVIAPAPLADKSVAMVDRTHVYTPVPEELLGAEYVMVANDDKDNANFELHITIGQAGTLYLLLDNRVGTNTGGQSTIPNPTVAGMTWMTQMGFVDTGLDVGIDESNDGDIDNYYSVFSKQVTPGVVILKAQNDTSTGGPGGRNMYGVAAAPLRVKASKPSPADGEPGLTLPLFQWTAGATAVLHNVYLGTSVELTEADRVGPSMSGTAYYHTMPLTPGLRYYWRVDEVEGDLTTVHTGDVWSFTVASLSAFQPVPADGAAWVDPDVDLSWKPGQGAITHDLYLDTDRAAVEAGTAGVSQKGFYSPTWKPPPTLTFDRLYYWRVDEIKADGTRTIGPVWSFRTVPNAVITDPNLIGWWKLDDGSGTRAFDMSGYAHHGTIQGATWTEGIQGGALQFAGADQVDLPPGLIRSKLGAMAFWMQTAQTTIGTIFYGTETAGNGYGGENELHVNVDTDQARLYIEGSTDVSVWSGMAINNNEWQHVAATWDATSVQLYVNGNQVGQAGNTGNDFTASAVTRLGRPTSGERYYIGSLDDVRLYNRSLSADEVKQLMRGDPLLAWDPQPPRNAIMDIRDVTVLSWSAGDAAQQHDVYFGQDQAAVANADVNSPAYQGRQTDTELSLADLVEFGGGGYSWRIDEVNGDGSISPGSVWSFTVADYLIVDEFESYNDEENAGTRIYETWIDGYTDSLSGSIVGNLDPPFAEQTIVHGGKQSMPMDYNNIDSPYFSQAYREFSPLANWTVGGVNDLSLWVRGRPVSFLQTASGFTMSGAGTDIFNATDEFRFAFKSLSGNGTIITKVESVDNTNAWAKAGVMIRETLDADSRYAFVCATPGNGVRFQGRLLNAGNATSDSAIATAEQMALTTPVWVKLERSGTSFSGFYSTDGVNWTAMAWNPQTIIMNTAYIGVAVTSHSAGVLATAVFSDITTSGSVSGSWQTVEVGVAQPGNSPDDLYLGVEDSTGKLKVVTNPDPTVVTSVTWTEWKIPLSSLTGVNLSKVKRIYIGVGDKENPAAGGTGRIYIDDIHVVRPAP